MLLVQIFMLLWLKNNHESIKRLKKVSGVGDILKLVVNLRLDYFLIKIIQFDELNFRHCCTRGT